MIERLDITSKSPYNAVEASIHLSRYLMAKPFIAGKKVLDVACGEGYGSYLMSLWGAKSVCGVDIDAPTVEIASSMFHSDGLEYQTCNAENLPFPDYTFDVITSFETIEHLGDPETFLSEIRRVLKPGGTILLSCPNDPYYYDNSSVDNPFHKHKYHFYDFREMTEKYLGKAGRYYLGFAADGFLTIPLENATFPEDKTAPDTMLELFRYQTPENTALLKQQNFMNYWNCNYYVGLWGADPGAAVLSSAVYPRELLVKLEDTDVALYHDLHSRMEAFTKAEDAVRQKADEMAELRAENARLKKENDELHIALPGTKRLKIENDRLRMMLELFSKELAAIYSSGGTAAYSEAETQLNYYRSECSRYENSTCWKITKPLRVIMDFLKKVFRK